MRTLRLAIVHNTIAPYRHLLFECLSKTLNLIVYYCSVKQSFRKWDLWPRKYQYRYTILSRIPLGNASINPSIVKTLLSSRPDIIVLGSYTDPTMWLAFVAARILRIPVACWTEGTKEPRSVIGAVTRPFRTLFIRRSRAIIVPGRLSRDYVISLGAEAEKVFIAPNAVDNAFFVNMSRTYEPCKKALKDKLGLRGRTIILYVGQLIKRKGIEYLLKAYSRLGKEHDGISLVLLGSGSLELQLKRLADRLRLSDFIIIHSGLNQEELVKLYVSADILVLPTLEDVWGFVINEAMACGLPVIATRASQAAVEMIREGENGLIVKEANSVQLYEALTELVSDDKLRERMARKSRIVLDRFDPKHMFDGFVKAIDYISRSS